MSEKTIYRDYLKCLYETARQGDAREESFYADLSQMLEAIAAEKGKPDVRVTTLPKSTDAGNPDFRLWNGRDRIVGYIEAKPPEMDNLDALERTEQIKRYRQTFPNFILTNFLDFRLYRDGQEVMTVRIAQPVVLNTLRSAPPLQKEDELSALLERFLDFSLPPTFTAETLAVELAKRTRFLKDVVAQEMAAEKGRGPLNGFFDAFQAYLIGSLVEDDFADLFAQTITYGLFAARVRAEREFNRQMAFNYIPHTIGVLRDLFRFISLGDPSNQLSWCVEDIAAVLAAADAPGILSAYYRQGKGSDPIVHFYETFLAQYDPAERERRGVYYTPEPVVGYIVRSLHEILKTRFGKPDGLADRGVTLLDPAAGTMTFIAKAAQTAVDEFTAKYGSGAKEEFIRDHILKDFYAFELMMAPYAVGHLKMSFFLEELGHRLADDERMPFYLTNTLEIDELEQSQLPGLSALAEESRLAGEVKKNTPVLVILGNPPYSGESSNKGAWITGLIEDYKQVDGKPLGEKNPKWLQDDYVKFLRFAQWKIGQAGRGVVGMITNHGYLDNPTFRGMRQSLMQTFDEIFVLNLHGNALKKETSPDGSPDQNVFDIRQGVAIAFFIKTGKNQKAKCRVHQADLFGLREEKYAWLNGHSRGETSWQELEPAKPAYPFIPVDRALFSFYQQFVPVNEIFPVNSVGIVTARDKLTIHFTEEEAWRTVNAFARMDPDLARQAYDLGEDAKDWTVELAQKDLQDSGLERGKIVPILYRPFDVRYTYYTGRSRGFHCRPRSEVMNHMTNINNFALIVPKRVEQIGPWRHSFVTKNITDHVCVSLKTIDYHFPILLDNKLKPQDLFSALEVTPNNFNISSALIEKFKENINFDVDPMEVFQYIYAILHSMRFREKYEGFLIKDFPRIPFSKNPDLFTKFSVFGFRLIKLHSLEQSEIDTPKCQFEGKGINLVESGAAGLRFDLERQRVYINADQYFAPVPPEVWQYQIGGYQVCDKWLKDRRGRRLSLDEIQTYCRIVTALGKTIEIQQEIDKLYPQVEASLIDFS